MPGWKPVQKYLPLIATVAVVLGIVAAARFNASRQPKSLQADSDLSAVSAEDTSWTAVLAGRTLTMTVDDGASKICALPDGFNFVDDVDSDGFTVRSATGARMLVGLDCNVKDSKLVPGIANPSGKRMANISGERRDGAAVIEISDGKYTEEITLRGKNSRPYRDAEVIGWLDDNIAVVTAFQGDARYALTVQTTGRITELVKLPDNAAEFRTGGGAFWYVTVTPSEGIELGPRGPSALHRVSQAGTDLVTAEEADAVIENVLISSNGNAAYLVGGTLKIRFADGEFQNAGTGKPLGWTATGSLIASREGGLRIIAPSGSSESFNLTIEGEITRAWRVTGGSKE